MALSKAALFALLSTACSGIVLISEDAAINEIIAIVNAAGASWTAGPGNHGLTMKDMRARLGTYHEAASGRSTIEAIERALGPLVDSLIGSTFDIPESFDAREQWPGLIHPIRDQMQCGSCWAFSASEVASDRLAIESKGAEDVVLSPQYLVSCDNNDGGCNGGYLKSAWQFINHVGIPSDSCNPYSSGKGDNGQCVTTCANGEAPKLYKATSFKHTSGFFGTRFGRAAAIQRELMTNGPIQVSFNVYQDFMAYTGGVYHHVTGAMEGGHAVKLVGWGVEAGKPYWLIANSWNTTWGEKGLFRIARGHNECGIEENAWAGIMSLD